MRTEQSVHKDRHAKVVVEELMVPIMLLCK